MRPAVRIPSLRRDDQPGRRRGPCRLKRIMAAVLHAITSTEEAKEAARVVLPTLAPLAEEFDPDTHGGAILLGVDGVCIISHGSSSARAIANAIRLAHDAVQGGLIQQVKAAVSH